MENLSLSIFSTSVSVMFAAVNAKQTFPVSAALKLTYTPGKLWDVFF